MNMQATMTSFTSNQAFSQLKHKQFLRKQGKLIDDVLDSVRKHVKSMFYSQINHSVGEPYEKRENFPLEVYLHLAYHPGHKEKQFFLSYQPPMEGISDLTALMEIVDVSDFMDLSYQCPQGLVKKLTSCSLKENEVVKLPLFINDKKLLKENEHEEVKQAFITQVCRDYSKTELDAKVTAQEYLPLLDFFVESNNQKAVKKLLVKDVELFMSVEYFSRDIWRREPLWLNIVGNQELFNKYLPVISRHVEEQHFEKLDVYQTHYLLQNSHFYTSGFLPHVPADKVAQYIDCYTDTDKSFNPDVFAPLMDDSTVKKAILLYKVKNGGVRRILQDDLPEEIKAKKLAYHHKELTENKKWFKHGNREEPDNFIYVIQQILMNNLLPNHKPLVYEMVKDNNDFLIFGIATNYFSVDFLKDRLSNDDLKKALFSHHLHATLAENEPEPMKKKKNKL